MNANPKMVALDYLSGEGEEIKAWQIVRFSEAEPWLVLDNGLLLATLQKRDGIWTELTLQTLDLGILNSIGRFIDRQHFNFLPDKIKIHWQEAVQEVIMQNDSAYLVVTKPETNFLRFKNVFSAFVADLVEDEWPIEFKVYNADFTDEFTVRVFQWKA